MMRKIIVGFLALTLALALLSGCGKDTQSEAESGDGEAVVESTAPENNTETSSETESAVPASNAEVTVEVPNGWSSVEGSAALAQYMNGIASFIVTCDTVPADVKGPDEYVKFAEEQYQKAFPDAVFTETKTITVDGVEGRDYSFTYSVSGMKMRLRVVYLLKGDKAYTLSCGTLDEEFDKSANDFQSMIDSFKLP